MDTNSFRDITIEDFDESDFADPISLLDALLKRGSANKQILSDFPKATDCLTVSQISRQYNVEVEEIFSAIKNGNLVADKVVPLFSPKVVESFLLDQNNGITLFDKFMHEITHMRVNYSYKPVLVMAIMRNASENGEIALSDLVDFFLDFYEKRRVAGLIIEKADSSFVKFQNNRQHAARTIIRYPITVFENKQFINFDLKTSVLTVAKSIWQRIDVETRAFIEVSCEKILEEYYALLS